MDTSQIPRHLPPAITISPTPIALEEWTQGPPGRDTLLDESSWPYADGWQGRARWEELQLASCSAG